MATPRMESAKVGHSSLALGLAFVGLECHLEAILETIDLRVPIAQHKTPVLGRHIGVALAVLLLTILQSSNPALGEEEIKSAAMPPINRSLRVHRFTDNPLIRPGMDSRMGTNVEGPSVILAPSWLEDPLGKYYLYFADHKGKYIRLAYADQLRGPWRMHTPGTLTLEQSHFLTESPFAPATSQERAEEGYATSDREGVFTAAQRATIPHIASPDVHVRADLERIVMYYHGLQGPALQVTRVATSKDGVHFEAREEILGRPYFRVFFYRDYWYALAMPGQFLRSKDGLSHFERGPMRFNPRMRHSAVLVLDDTLWVFWTQAGDKPERILLSSVDLRGDWKQWHESDPTEVLRPEFAWEGAELPLEASVRGAVNVPVHQLRDPALLVEGQELFLFYAVQGESGIAGARVYFPPHFEAPK